MRTVNSRVEKERICPHLEQALILLGKKWNAMILTVLLKYGSLRFKQLSKCVNPCSDRVLVERLKELETSGLVKRVTYEGSSLIEYQLTSKGKDLDQTLKSLHEWSDKWLCQDQ